MLNKYAQYRQLFLINKLAQLQRTLPLTKKAARDPYVYSDRELYRRLRDFLNGGAFTTGESHMAEGPMSFTKRYYNAIRRELGPVGDLLRNIEFKAEPGSTMVGRIPAQSYDTASLIMQAGRNSAAMKTLGIQNYLYEALINGRMIAPKSITYMEDELMGNIKDLNEKILRETGQMPNSPTRSQLKKRYRDELVGIREKIKAYAQESAKQNPSEYSVFSKYPIRSYVWPGNGVRDISKQLGENIDRFTFLPPEKWLADAKPLLNARADILEYLPRGIINENSPMLSNYLQMSKEKHVPKSYRDIANIAENYEKHLRSRLAPEAVNSLRHLVPKGSDPISAYMNGAVARMAKEHGIKQPMPWMPQTAEEFRAMDTLGASAKNRFNINTMFNPITKEERQALSALNGMRGRVLNEGYNQAINGAKGVARGAKGVAKSVAQGAQSVAGTLGNLLKKVKI